MMTMKTRSTQVSGQRRRFRALTFRVCFEHGGARVSVVYLDFLAIDIIGLSSNHFLQIISLST
jgi:hypothetical protein